MNKLPHHHNDKTTIVINKMPSIEKFQEASLLFQPLGDTSRLRILWIVCHCEECVSNIASAVNMSVASVSHHLKILKLSGLIVSRRDGKEIYYSMADSAKSQLIHDLIENYFEITCPLL